MFGFYKQSFLFVLFLTIELSNLFTYFRYYTFFFLSTVSQKVTLDFLNLTYLQNKDVNITATAEPEQC